MSSSVHRSALQRRCALQDGSRFMQWSGDAPEEEEESGGVAMTQDELAALRQRVADAATNLHNAQGCSMVVDGRVYVDDAQTLLAEVDQLRALGQRLYRAIQVALDGADDDLGGAMTINAAEEAWEAYLNEA
jgi:hypothetical protein